MMDKKFIFEDLNSFVDGRLMELAEDEQRFQNQVLGVTEMFQNAMSSREKLEVLCNRLLQCKMIQETVDCILNGVQKCQEKWEEFLHDFENRCNCECAVAVQDNARTRIYQLADKIFTTLTNYYEMIEHVESKITTYIDIKKGEPIHLMFEVVNGIVSMLEKLNLHIQKLQELANVSEYLKYYLSKKCHCR